ncbi:MAG: phosphomannomutase/phosphoglucomutase [Deltaproteobacteria bacterium]|nr:phosphomannomutase/phosphoglucomutase [Deltaproteobacteria bacterium]MBW2072835.1 phosphomannomutase/phosphoglucomutase [Deltaproteobacteria bacterium]
MDAKTFREYDIRGIVGSQITEADVSRLGRTFGTYMAQQGKHKLTVGRDVRPSSIPFRDALIEGLLESGARVIDLGICPTPVFYFSLRHLQVDGGMMITASHNPPEYNGFKICDGADTLYGPYIQQLRELMDRGDFASGQGTLESYDIVTPYHQYILDNIKLERPLRVGLDAANAVGGPVALPLLRDLGCEVYDLYCEPDGSFPNHEPDPTVLENLLDLIELVQREKLDVGISYDGDCDRIGVVDEQGRVVYGDKLMIIFAREILSRRPGATFISEVKCSKTLYEDIEKHGGKAIMWKTGHSLIKKKMKEVDAALAGEMSGHMFFADRYFGFDDAIYASCRLLEILASTGKTIAELLEGVPNTVVTPEIRVECPDEIKFTVVERVTDQFRRSYSIIDVDGVRVLFDHGWGLVRASNTQPALVLRFEAETESQLEEYRQIVEQAVEKIRRDLES